MRIRVRRGLDIPIAGQPEQRIEDANPVGWVALVARDYRGLRPRLTVELGDRVRLGQPLLTDKANPSVVFASPGCGEVVAIHRGERRSLQSVVVRLEGDDEEKIVKGYFRDIAPFSGSVKLTGAGMLISMKGEMKGNKIGEDDELPSAASLDLYEKKALLRALNHVGGDKLAAARLLRVGKSTLYRKLKRFEIS